MLGAALGWGRLTSDLLKHSGILFTLGEVRSVRFIVFNGRNRSEQ